MNHALQVELVRRVLAHVEHRTTDTAGEPSTLPIEAYADAARFDRERAKLFHDYPLAIGHISQLLAPGDFFTHDATGMPLLVTRGDDGTIRAFVNVCRHRGTRVEPSACGSRKQFTCPYHAWTYGRDGSLVGVPHERAFVAASELVRGRRNLVQVPLGVAAGLIFVEPRPVSPGESTDLDVGAWLGPLVDDLESFDVATSHAHRPHVTTRELSWKLAIDVFLETYHLRTTHADSIYPMFFDNLGLVDPVGPHLRNVFPKRSIEQLADTPESGWKLRDHANVLFHVFPNTLVLVEPDHAAVLHLWPDGPGRAVLTSYMLVPEAPDTDKARAYWAANDDILMNAIGEDFAMGESIQRGLASGANREVVFGAFEHALTHFHAQVARLSG